MILDADAKVNSEPKLNEDDLEAHPQIRKQKTEAPHEEHVFGDEAGKIFKNKN